MNLFIIDLIQNKTARTPMPCLLISRFGLLNVSVRYLAGPSFLSPSELSAIPDPLHYQ